MSVDETAKAILADDWELTLAEIDGAIPTIEVKAMSRLWLLLPEIREVADNALMFASTEGSEHETEMARALLAKLSDESLSKDSE